MAARLYLASTSRYRATQLERLGLPFSIEAPEVNEATVAGEAPRDRARRLAAAKAAAVSSRHPQDWVLGSDQVAVCAGRIHDKPGSAHHCQVQLRASSGQAVEFHTAVALMCGQPSAVHEHVDYTIVRFRQITDHEIARYVERERPFDCAGGFRCEGLGVTLFEAVETLDPTALVGLPLIWVAQALRAVGPDPLGSDQA